MQGVISIGNTMVGYPGPSGTGPAANPTPTNPSPNITPGPEPVTVVDPSSSVPVVTNPSPNITPGPEPVTVVESANPTQTQTESIASRLFGVNPTLPIVQQSQGSNIQQAGFGSGWVIAIIILVLILSPIKMKTL